MRMRGFVAIAVLLCSATALRPVCQVADALTSSVEHHIADWDIQVAIVSNSSHNCSVFLKYLYTSRSKIRTELIYILGNLTVDYNSAGEPTRHGLQPSASMNRMSAATSLLAAHLHIHGGVAFVRPECLSEPMHLLFMTSLRRLTELMDEQFGYIWVILQGTPEQFHARALKWLQEVVELLDSDVRLFQITLGAWQPPEALSTSKHHWAVLTGQDDTQGRRHCVEDEAISAEPRLASKCCNRYGIVDTSSNCVEGLSLASSEAHCKRLGGKLCSFAELTGATNPCKTASLVRTGDPCFPAGPPLPPFSTKAENGVGLSTLEVLRREALDDWNDDVQRPVYRALLRHVLPRDGHVVDFCAGSGSAADFLNSTGLVTVYAFDPSLDIEHLGRFAVTGLAVHAETLRLWRSFDVALCLLAADYFGTAESAWGHIFKNIEAHSSTAVLGCGEGAAMRTALIASARHAPQMRYDEVLSSQLASISGDKNVCAFRRSP